MPNLKRNTNFTNWHELAPTPGPLFPFKALGDAAKKTTTRLRVAAQQQLPTRPPWTTSSHSIFVLHQTAPAVHGVKTYHSGKHQIPSSKLQISFNLQNSSLKKTRASEGAPCWLSALEA